MEAENEPKKENRKPSSFNQGLRYILLRIKKITRLNTDTDKDAAVQSITKSIDFRGANLWILAFATIVASVGLDTNSTAVIIGAMLISPLMGPINGIGLAIGISDSELLRKSLTNFLLMVGISLLASTFYFLVSPLSDAQSELLARTRPTIFDVIIAFTGGMAGIIAISRKEQPFTIISGVAIATALMPPLCTAGFGLATGQLKFFLGAFYLFFLNSVFIALATYLMVRFMHFPQRKYLDQGRKKRVKQYITFVTVLAIVPSVIMAINVIREAAFNNNAIRFINDIQDSVIFENTELVNSKKEYGRKERTIHLSLIGQPLSNKDSLLLNQMLIEHGLTKTKLTYKQTVLGTDVISESAIVENILDKKDQQIALKDSLIRHLQEQSIEQVRSSLSYENIAKEVAVQYPNVTEISISDMTYITLKDMTNTTIPTVYVKWASKPSSAQKKQLINWLKVRMNVEDVRLLD